MFKFFLIPLLLVTVTVLFYFKGAQIKQILGPHALLIVLASMAFAFGVGLVLATSGLNISIL